MKLYYTPGACSLAVRISLYEAGIEVDFDKVDLRARTTETGASFLDINPKGYVPALQIDDGNLLTENLAILFWVTEQAPGMTPEGSLGRYRLVETLAFISTEIHKGFKPFFLPGASDADKANASAAIVKRLDLIARTLGGPFLFGHRFTAADAYLFVTLRWARKFGVAAPAPLAAYFERVSQRESVREALAAEGLD